MGKGSFWPQIAKDSSIGRFCLFVFFCVFLVMVKSSVLEPPGCLISLCGVESFYTCNDRDYLHRVLVVRTSPLPNIPNCEVSLGVGRESQAVSEREHFPLIFSYCWCDSKASPLVFLWDSLFCWWYSYSKWSKNNSIWIGCSTGSHQTPGLGHLFLLGVEVVTHMNTTCSFSWRAFFFLPFIFPFWFSLALFPGFVTGERQEQISLSWLY